MNENTGWTIFGVTVAVLFFGTLIFGVQTCGNIKVAALENGYDEVLVPGKEGTYWKKPKNKTDCDCDSLEVYWGFTVGESDTFPLKPIRLILK